VGLLVIPVFVSKRDGDEDVWMLRDGQATPITAQGLIVRTQPGTPDASRVAFTSGPVEDLDLYTMAADGSDRRLVWLPGAGNTTLAKQLAVDRSAVRLTKDEPILLGHLVEWASAFEEPDAAELSLFDPPPDPD
jgi:hypothetical protein